MCSLEYFEQCIIHVSLGAFDRLGIFHYLDTSLKAAC